MKKITAIIILILVLGLVGCVNSGTKNIDTDSSKTKVEDQAKDKENIENSIQQLSNLIDKKKYDEAKSLIQKLNSKGLDEAQKVDIDKLRVRMDSKAANNAKEASSEMKGGTMEPVLYTGSLADTTKKDVMNW